jgi:TRAP-type mannitol/chloroaromatic compound transport system permease large subunit
VITVAMLVVMVGLMAVRVPVAISIGVAATLGVFLSDVPLELIPRTMTEAVDSFTLLAVPFFILAGNLMNVGGMTVRIFNFARRLLGHLHGGLAHVNIGGSMIFAGMSGAALADLAGLGSVEMKAMREHGYDIRFAAALSLASCTSG